MNSSTIHFVLINTVRLKRLDNITNRPIKLIDINHKKI